MTNKQQSVRKEAVALAYEKKYQSPRVIAKGKGVTAENILEIARERHIPIQEDPSLVELLGKLHIDEKIPEELYQAVAEVFSFIYQLDKRVD
ncbi:EscU/YscU/HrcU family type III secretion system export apparatus switch protein [Bacillaceae bacterium Marseille-Q3522]|nr:EscU/YscU/HrcU family type III secretion system export apparatus switch protein [Bacillaceae bacterium Marseille-Q3522]